MRNSVNTCVIEYVRSPAKDSNPTPLGGEDSVTAAATGVPDYWKLLSIGTVVKVGVIVPEFAWLLGLLFCICSGVSFSHRCRCWPLLWVFSLRLFLLFPELLLAFPIFVWVLHSEWSNLLVACKLRHLICPPSCGFLDLQSSTIWPGFPQLKRLFCDLMDLEDGPRGDANIAPSRQFTCRLRVSSRSSSSWSQDRLQHRISFVFYRLSPLPWMCLSNLLLSLTWVSPSLFQYTLVRTTSGSSP